jgi:hypothetical protein
MQTVQEFMECYLREKAGLHEAQRRQSQALHEKYYSKDYQKSHLDWHAWREKNPEIFTMAEVSDESAHIITTDFYASNRRHRYRYHLRTAGGRWEIHKKESECFVCHGVGLVGKDTCNFCSGAGWRDFRPNAA